MTTTEILQKAKALIERGWTQNVLARDSNGKSCRFDSPEAVRWCAGSALYAACPNRYKVPDNAIDLIQRAIGSENIVGWNDDSWRTKEEVLVVFDKAIELSEKV